MGGCQNHGPLLGPLYIRCRIILRTQQGTIILTTTHMAVSPALLRSNLARADSPNGHSGSVLGFGSGWLVRALGLNNVSEADNKVSDNIQEPMRLFPYIGGSFLRVEGEMRRLLWKGCAHALDQGKKATPLPALHGCRAVTRPGDVVPSPRTSSKQPRAHHQHVKIPPRVNLS